MMNSLSVYEELIRRVFVNIYADELILTDDLHWAIDTTESEISRHLLLKNLAL